MVVVSLIVILLFIVLFGILWSLNIIPKPHKDSKVGKFLTKITKKFKKIPDNPELEWSPTGLNRGTFYSIPDWYKNNVYVKTVIHRTTYDPLAYSWSVEVRTQPEFTGLVDDTLVYRIRKYQTDELFAVRSAECIIDQIENRMIFQRESDANIIDNTIVLPRNS